MAIPDLVRDSKLETYYLPNCTVQTVHKYQEPDLESGRELVTREEHWQRGKEVGSGGYASVWLEECTKGARSERRVRAVKQIDIRGQFGAIDYNRELEAIAKFSQSKYERCFVKSLGWYDSPEYLLIAMEYLEMGDLSRYLDKRPALPEAEVQEITYQILDGLNMMHDNNFAHRDLKPNNILIQSHPPHEWWVKISDFGISKNVEEASAPSTTLRGTSGYIAPELYGLIERGTPFASDIWSLGQIVFQLLTKEVAFKHLGSLVKYVARTEQFPTGRLSKYSALSVKFITSLACPVPRDRMTAAVAFTHAWIKSKPSPSNSETNISPYTSETNVSPHTEDLSTMTSMSESCRSWNTKPSSPVPGIVDDVPKKKISSHGVDIGLWRAFTAHNFDGSVNGKLSFSPNGEWLVIPDGKHARLWNTVNGSAVSTPIDQDGNIRVAAFSPNGRYLATGGTRLMVWDIATGLKFPRRSFSVGQNVQDVAFSPDNKLLAFSSASKFGVWDIHSGEMLFKTSSDVESSDASH